jgi:hypothetical protein
MSLHPFFGNRPFEQEQITILAEAFKAVCASLGLGPVDDPATRLVAEKIIEYAQRGVRDATTLATMTLSEFKPESH